MNELAANIIFVYFTEAQGYRILPETEQKSKIATFYDTKYAEEDIYCIFESIMNSHVEMFKHNLDNQKKQ